MGARPDTAARWALILETLGGDLEPWAHQCHAASAHVVKAGVLAPARVARGSCVGVGGQHSWIVLGDDCYDDDAEIVDPTLWSYRDDVVGVWSGSYRDGLHRPFGKGNIFQWGRPESAVGEPMELTPDRPWSVEAQQFLALLGPLDRRGWAQLAHAPVEGWPAGEIIEAMTKTAGLEALVPIDIVGMVTDLNPHGLYLATKGAS